MRATSRGCCQARTVPLSTEPTHQSVSPSADLPSVDQLVAQSARRLAFLSSPRTFRAPPSGAEFFLGTVVLMCRQSVWGRYATDQLSV